MHDNIYSTVPDKEEVKKTEIEKVLEFLKENADHYFTAFEIANKCGMPNGGTQVKVRNSIAILRDNSEPIVSAANGFCYTIDEDKISECIEELEKRIFGINRAIEGLRRARDGRVQKLTERDVKLKWGVG